MKNQAWLYLRKKKKLFCSYKKTSCCDMKWYMCFVPFDFILEKVTFSLFCCIAIRLKLIKNKDNLQSQHKWTVCLLNNTRRISMLTSGLLRNLLTMIRIKKKCKKSCIVYLFRNGWLYSMRKDTIKYLVLLTKLMTVKIFIISNTIFSFNLKYHTSRTI